MEKTTVTSINYLHRSKVLMQSMAVWDNVIYTAYKNSSSSRNNNSNDNSYVNKIR